MRGIIRPVKKHVAIRLVCDILVVLLHEVHVRLRLSPILELLEVVFVRKNGAHHVVDVRVPAA